IEQNRSFGCVVIVEIVGSELEIPFELAGVGIQGEDTIGIEVVAGTRCSVEIGGGIAGAPVDGIEFWIVGARHPSGAAPAQVHFAGPTGRAGLAGAGNSPKTPSELAGFRAECGNEAAHAIVAAGSSDNDFVLYDERRAGGAVIFVPFRVGDVPKQMTGAGVETEKMGVVGFKIDAVTP